MIRTEARKTVTLDDIEVGLNRVIDPADEIVVFHSGLWRFGHTVRPMPHDFVDQLLDCVLKVVGSDRTLLISAYTTSTFPREKTYDLKRNQPETGDIAIAMLKRGCAERTIQPMNSYLVMGPRTKEILDCPCTTAWGDDSVMAFLERERARFVTLGEVWHEACSYYHRSEEICRVPYRYFKRFEGELLENGRSIGRCSETFFVKSLNVHCDDFYAGPELVLRERNLTVDAGGSNYILESALVKDIIEVTCEILADDPYYFVQNRDTVEAWVKSGMLEEIAGLAPDQEYADNAKIIRRNEEGQKPR